MRARIRGNVELGQRAYGPEATREESEAIAERVSVIDERILFLRELPIIEVPAQLPTDDQNVDSAARLDPKTCTVTTQFVAP